MSKLLDVIRPGAMISQICPNSRDTEGETLRIIELVLQHGFFQALQTVEIPHLAERRAIANILSEHKLPLTYCVSRVLTENTLNLSDLDATNRKRSYEMVIKCMDDALETGANSITFISGPRPSNPDLRHKALDFLLDSLEHICYEAKKNYPGLQATIEPMDYYAHKKNTLGTIAEAVTLCEHLREKQLQLFLCLDTAHSILNNEDPIEALRISKHLVNEFHFCNCVTDMNHPLYGDNHIPFGEPGCLTGTSIADIMKQSFDMNYYNTLNKPTIFCEVMNREQHDPVILLEQHKNILTEAWD